MSVCLDPTRNTFTDKTLYARFIGDATNRASNTRSRTGLLSTARPHSNMTPMVPRKPMRPKLVATKWRVHAPFLSPRVEWVSYQYSRQGSRTPNKGIEHPALNVVDLVRSVTIKPDATAYMWGIKNCVSGAGGVRQRPWCPGTRVPRACGRCGEAQAVSPEASSWAQAPRDRPWAELPELAASAAAAPRRL